LASPESVRKALANAYPWFESALKNALVKHQTYLMDSSLDASAAGLIIQSFIEDPEMRLIMAPLPPNNTLEWTQLGSQSIWEHTGWFTNENVNSDVRKYFYEWDTSHYVDMPDVSHEERSSEILQRKAPFIALVNSKGEFKSLLERQKLLEQVAESMLKE
jgi:hypothetical protein